MKTINLIIMQIGKAIFNFNEQGKQVSAYFMPTMRVNVNVSLLENISTGQSSEIIKKNAEVALASWFAKMNEIELADRDEWKIESVVDTCTNYSSGGVRMCVVAFNLVKINELQS